MDYLGFCEKEIEDTIRHELTKKVVEILEIPREINVMGPKERLKKRI